MKRKNLWLAGAVTTALAAAYVGIGNYFFNYALKRDKKEFLEANPNLATSQAIDSTREAREKEADQAFGQRNRPRQVTNFSNDKHHLKLHADYYTNEQAGNRWAVVMHGYTSNASEMMRWVRGFHERDFQVLVPDMRGHGRSEGKYIGMGWPDRMDLLQWINWVLRKDPQAEIVLFGLSMGAATVMMASGEELPDNVKVIVEDCGYSSVSGVFEHQLGELFGLPPFPVVPAANTMTNIRAGYDLYKASATEQVAKSKTPMLFIHGDNDTFVPFEMINDVYAAAKVEKERLIIPQAEHGDSVKVAPDLYWETVANFVNRFIPAAGVQ